MDISFSVLIWHFLFLRTVAVDPIEVKLCTVAAVASHPIKLPAICIRRKEYCHFCLLSPFVDISRRYDVLADKIMG